MSERLKVAWLAPYPLRRLLPDLEVIRALRDFHACSWIINLSEALSHLPEVDLHLITESTAIIRPQTIRKNSITFHIVPVGLPFVHRGFPGWLPVDVLTGFGRRAWLLAKQVRVIAPDIVHAHGTEAGYARAACKLHFPFLVSIQGVITEYQKADPSFQFAVLRYWEQSAVKRCRYVTCRTAFDTGFVRAYNPAARIFDIAEAMNPVFFATERRHPAEPVLLFVGSLGPRKGLADLLHALVVVRQSMPATRLLVVGGSNGGPPTNLDSLVNQLGLGRAVEFLGPKTAKEIVQIQRQAQLFVLPSLIENSPNSLAEAMVAGMPVVATAVGGVPSMVEDGRTGLLVPARDPQALAEKIGWLLQNPTQANALGKAAQQVARQRHHPTTVAEQTLAAYRKILEQSAQP